MTELKPCPFCGGKAEVGRKANFKSSDRLGWEFGVRCKNCHASTPQQHYKLAIDMDLSGEIVVVVDEREKAIAAWNRRVVDE